MKTCPSCGYNNTDDSLFCTSCGNMLASECSQAQTSTSADTMKDDRINIVFPNSSSFVSSDEYVVATLSNGMALNLISGEGLKTEDAILTNKRLYYNHQTGVFNISTQEEKVNVKDITGSKIASFNPIGILIMSILFFVVGIISILSRIFGFVQIFLPIAFVLFLLYFITKKSHLKIEYAGGAIYFSVKKYGKENIRMFQKSIYAIKDYIDSNQE